MRMKPARAPLIAIFLWALMALSPGPLSTSEKPPRRVSFGVFGDVPYNAIEESLFPRLIEELNQDRDLDFVVHVGDFKDGGFTRCSDQVFQRAKAWFDLSKYPLIYTPGDNEWTDCHRFGLGGYDPLERLAALRQIFFDGELSLGQKPLPIDRQSRDPAYEEFRENARWTIEQVVFATLHIVGSNNNLGRGAEGDAEHYKRTNAALSWLREAFALARTRELRAVVLFLHADPAFEDTPDRRTGFKTFLSELEAQAREFKKPVLLVHGDTHRFRVDQPLVDSRDGQRVKTLTRLETFGSPFVDWVKVTIDPEPSPTFKIAPAGFGNKTRRTRSNPS